MAAVVRDVWGLVTCLLGPRHIWGAVEPCRDCGCASKVCGCDQGALAHVGHVSHVVGMWHAEVSSCFLYGRGQGHGEGIIGMVHALVHCARYVCVGGHMFFTGGMHAFVHAFVAHVQKSQIRKGWMV